FFEDLDYPQGYDEKAVKKWFGVPYLRPMLEREIEGFSGAAEWRAQSLELVSQNVAADLGVKFADVVHPTRVAATGRTVGPGLFETLEALGPERTLGRLNSVLNQLTSSALEGIGAAAGGEG
ncbi:MAG TPA: hypothetical protein VKT32_07590, partial [Chthonomonadaceae bacterium]|nr:hypothetical protein [Chthonomonadaceae bacterium]